MVCALLLLALDLLDLELGRVQCTNRLPSPFARGNFGVITLLGFLAPLSPSAMSRSASRNMAQQLCRGSD